MGPDRLEKMSNWFENCGNKLLLIAYFIPGVRHFTPVIFSGITHISFRTLAIYAYIELSFNKTYFPLENYSGRSGSISILR